MSSEIIRFRCANCQANLRLKGRPGSGKVQCPACRQINPIPVADQIYPVASAAPRPPPAPAVVAIPWATPIDPQPPEPAQAPKQPRPTRDESDYDDEPPRRRRPRYDDNERPPKPVHAESHSLGVSSLVLGCLSLVLAFMPCIGFFAIPIAALGLLLGLIGGLIALARAGRGIGYPIGGSALNGMALAMGLAWFAAVDATIKNLDKTTIHQPFPGIKAALKPSPATINAVTPEQRAEKQRQEETDRLAAARAKELANPVTMDKYNRTLADMNYAQVVEIIGVHGRELSRVTFDGTTTAIISWSNANGSNMNVTFQGGRVMAKAQFGLR